MSRAWPLIMLTIGVVVPVVGAPVVVFVTGLGSPYEVNAMALFLAGGIYAPVAVLTASGAVAGHLLVRRLLSWGLALELPTLVFAGVAASSLSVLLLAPGYERWTDSVPNWALTTGATLIVLLVLTVLRAAADVRTETAPA